MQRKEWPASWIVHKSRIYNKKKNDTVAQLKSLYRLSLENRGNKRTRRSRVIGHHENTLLLAAALRSRGTKNWLFAAMTSVVLSLLVAKEGSSSVQPEGEKLWVRQRRGTAPRQGKTSPGNHAGPCRTPWRNTTKTLDSSSGRRWGVRVKRPQGQ